MSTAAALNRPQRCVQELSDFDCAMGWAFQDLTLHDPDHEDDDLDRVHRDHKRREHTHTAFDKRVEIPADFVAPSGRHTRPKSASHAHHHHDQPHTKRPTKSAVHSAAYSKRATGPTAASKRPASASAVRSGSHHSRHSPSRSPSPPRDGNVDFVYDVNVRRALRERMDAERVATRREAALKESRLRAAHKWVHDKPGGGPRKQAWPTETPPREASTRPPRPRAKAVSTKTAIAPNVSEWRTQETPFHAPPVEAQRAQRELHARARQQREAEEVARALDAFEQQWG